MKDFITLKPVRWLTLALIRSKLVSSLGSTNTWVKVFRINPEYQDFGEDFPQKVSLKMLN